MELSQKCQKQWICREWVEELGLNEWDNSYIEFPGQSNRNEPSLYKKVCPRHNPKSYVLVYIRWQWLQE